MNIYIYIYMYTYIYIYKHIYIYIYMPTLGDASPPSNSTPDFRHEIYIQHGVPIRAKSTMTHSCDTASVHSKQANGRDWVPCVA